MSPFWKYAKRMTRRRRTLVGAAIMAMISAGGLSAGLLGIVPVLQNILGKEQATLRTLARREGFPLPESLLQRLPDEPFASVVWLIGGLAILTLLGATANFFHQTLSYTVASSTVADIRRSVFRHCLHLPLSRTAGAASDLVSRMLHDTEMVYRGLVAVTSKALAQVAKGLAALTAALVIDWRLTLAALVGAPILYTVIRKLGKRIKKASRGAMQAKASLLAIAGEALAGHRVVKVYGAERSRLGRFTRHNAVALKQELRARTARALSSPLTEIISIFVIGGLAIVAAKAIIDGDMAFERFIATLAALAIAGAQLKPLSRIVQEINAADAAAERLDEILDWAPDATEAARVRLPRLARHAESLGFEGVRFRYPGATEEALAGVDLSIRAGERVAFVGPNGCGKTTLLALVPRLFEPSGGRVLIDGRDIAEHDLRSVRRQIGVVTQDVVLFSGTVRENLVCGRVGVTDEQIDDALRRARATEFVERLPDGIETSLGEGGVSLSGGQRQRLSIARAVLRDPSILILDEATSMIDAESERWITEAVAEFSEGRTCLMVAHRMGALAGADRIVVMQAGRVIDQGSYDDLLGRCPLFASLAAGATAPSPARA